MNWTNEQYTYCHIRIEAHTHWQCQGVDKVSWDAVVTELDVTGSIQQNVGRLHVPMNDTHLTMQILQGMDHLRQCTATYQHHKLMLATAANFCLVYLMDFISHEVKQMWWITDTATENETNNPISNCRIWTS